LVSNALKYTKDNGKVSITIEQMYDRTILKVIDTGIGISEEEVSKVFNSFYRTSNTADHPEIKGIGLGLSIAKRLCDILGITISISSQENIGTTLELSIP